MNTPNNKEIKPILLDNNDDFLSLDTTEPLYHGVMADQTNFPDDIPDDLFVKINFRMRIGTLIDSTIMQLYPFDLAHSIYKLFQRRK